MRPITPAALLLVLASAAACGGEDPGRPTYDDPARPIEVRPGGEFDVALKSNQSTGYQWVLVDSAALGPLSFAGSRYAVPERYRDHNGAGGTETWSFRAPAAGEGVISLIYVRPWEKEVPKDTTRFRVTVR